MNATQDNLPQLSEEDLIKLYHADASIQLASYTSVKRWLDLALASILVVPALPIIGVLVLMVRLSSTGPGIFRQKRVGLHGQVFTIYKLRSMRVDAESKLGPTWSGKSDVRTTWLGRWLRKLHLDELPQVFNVLNGDMSLIGPRPERPEFMGLLVEQVPGYVNRLSVVPGVTGLAQINLPPDSDLKTVQRKQKLDLEYIAQANLFLDLRILVSTFLRMVGLPGEWAMNLMGLQRDISINGDGVKVLKASQTPTTIAELCDTVAGIPSSNGNGRAKTSGQPAPSANGNGKSNGRATTCVDGNGQNGTNGSKVNGATRGTTLASNDEPAATRPQQVHADSR